MSLTVLVLFVVSVVCDVFGQVAFKLGADRMPDWSEGLAAFTRGLFRDGWVLVGFATYVIEFFVWLRILAEVPLSVAFPIASINILGIVLAGRLVLGERVTARRWAGAGIVTVGIVMVAGTL